MPTIGDIRPFAFTFVPRGWLECDGRAVRSAEFAALFRVIGTTYGGTMTNFMLPDLRGRTLMGQGTGYGLSPREIGQALGSEGVALTLDQIPAHTHGAEARIGPPAGARHDPKGGDRVSRLLANAQQPARAYVGLPVPTPVPMHQLTVGLTGSGKPHENRQPLTPMLFCIAWEGDFPQLSDDQLDGATGQG